EGRNRVERHRKQRAGKGFDTIECYQNVGSCAKQIENGIVLLECMSNLVANELFQQEQKQNQLELRDFILQQINELANGSKYLIIVTNEVFSDGIQYDLDTIECYQNVGSCAKQIENGIVLLECMSNLVANELFQQEQKQNQLELRDFILQQINELANGSKYLIIVTNEVFSDGIQYDLET